MYSPRIREELIPRIYRAAKRAGMPMTRWVNRLIEQALPEKVEINTEEINRKRKEKRNNAGLSLAKPHEPEGGKRHDPL